MYMGEPQRVAAITPSCRKRAKPKSAVIGIIILFISTMILILVISGKYRFWDECRWAEDEVFRRGSAECSAASNLGGRCPSAAGPSWHRLFWKKFREFLKKKKKLRKFLQRKKIKEIFENLGNFWKKKKKELGNFWKKQKI